MQYFTYETADIILNKKVLSGRMCLCTCFLFN